jgi:hypothetical protein
MTDIDVTSDDTLTLAAACRLLPRGRNGAKPHLSTILRWILQGAKAPNGERVRLEACRLGGRWLTSKDAIQRFCNRLTPQLDTPAAPAPRSPGQRRHAAERAEKELGRIGI